MDIHISLNTDIYLLRKNNNTTLSAFFQGNAFVCQCVILIFGTAQPVPMQAGDWHSVIAWEVQVGRAQRWTQGEVAAAGGRGGSAVAGGCGYITIPVEMREFNVVSCIPCTPSNLAPISEYPFTSQPWFMLWRDMELARVLGFTPYLTFPNLLMMKGTSNQMC